ncbi:MAG: carbamoyltransferase HypF [Nitrospinales bacterium]
MSTLIRVSISLRGLLQGVGFRPFVYKLANEVGLKGWVINTSTGIIIEVEGNPDEVNDFLSRLQDESPSNTVFHEMESFYLAPVGYKEFEIRTSDNSEEPSTLLLPDIATCPDCLSELFDRSNRRYLYPFINCTHCGPRFSIVEALPYDRSRTSMKNFQMCENCQNEYINPEDRRFHAQPNACHNCGPNLEFWGNVALCEKEDALDRTVSALKDGAIVAVKGLGGFHLMVNAADGHAVRTLRKRKNREEKPWALMFRNLDIVKNECEVSSFEKQILLSPEAPIVLLKRKFIKDSSISNDVAPSNPYLGVMLPSTPLHHILMNKLDFPVVATSGNISDETICYDNSDAFSRLINIADYFLINNRDIVSPCDDSIVRVVAGKRQVLRRARGYAPLPITVTDNLPPMIGVGGHLKNTVAMARGRNIFVSQHIGDLGNAQTNQTFDNTITSLTELYKIRSASNASDFHPDYSSTHWAEKNSGSKFPVQHHVAHVFSCMAEHNLEGPLLGIAWDGSGYGLDGTIWGGEFFHITKESIHRTACWRPFPLPGGDAAIREPRRSALGLLYRVFGESIFEQSRSLKNFSYEEIAVLKTMLNKNINCAMTSSCGRLFDAVASIIGIRQKNFFEGQAAMELEYSIKDTITDDFYNVNINEGNFINLNSLEKESIPDYYNLDLKLQLDQTQIIHEISQDISLKIHPIIMATKFHNGLAKSIVSIAKHIGEERVVLSGGCFQNKYLTEQSVRLLLKEGFKPYWHQKIPPNDGGLALGQIYLASKFEIGKEASSVLSGAR